MNNERSNNVTRKPFPWRLWGILVAAILVSVILVTPYALSLQQYSLQNAQLPMPLYLLLHVSDGTQAGFLTLMIGAAAGVALWLPALFLTRHPAHLEVRIALAALMARWPRPASA